MAYVKVEKLNQVNERILLSTTKHYPARIGPSFQVILDLNDTDIEMQLADIYEAAMLSHYLVVDLETRGGDYSIPYGPGPEETEIVGIGLAWDTGSVYLDLSSFNYKCIESLLLDHPRLVAHNIYFDGGYLKRLLGKHLNWSVCTYALLGLLANEGYPGEGWGLKGAMVEYLGWAHSNETELDEWLCMNGHYKGPRRATTDQQELLKEHREGALKPEKGQMWRAPKEVLGKYCALDCEGTYLLLTEVLLPVMGDFPGLQKMYPDVVRHILGHIDQKIKGIPVDREALQELKAKVDMDMETFLTEFQKLPACQDYISELRDRAIQQLMDIQPAKFLKAKECKEPTKYTSKGEISKNWEKWSLKVSTPAQISKNWIKWNEKLMQVQEGRTLEFNINSDQQLRELLYYRINFQTEIFTESGLPATSIKAFSKMGDLGKILIEYNYLLKERGFLDSYLELTETRPTIHPSFRIPGTLSGRLSSKGPNLQQVPKTKRIMELFQARPGYIWVDLDFSSLEPVVVAEFSNDRNMRFLFEDGTRPNCPYLFLGAMIPGEIGEQIRETGYDPFNPSKHSVAKAKKEVKGIRQICKAVSLACSYGAGARKVNQTLEDSGIYLPYDQVELIHSTYWETFKDVRKFEEKLQREWRQRGYVLNGMGRPMCTPEHMYKDLLNRFIQSTGHDILVKYVCILTRELSKRSIPWEPLLLDMHDATTIEVPERYAERTVLAFNESMDILNAELGGDLKLRGVPTVGRDLAEVKEPSE